MQEIATRQEMTKKLTYGVGGVGAGVGLLIITALKSSPLFWVAAGVCAIAGVIMILSKKQTKAGVVMLGAGILAGVAGLATLALGPVLGGIAGVGLIVLGGISLFRFFRDLKKRS
ncbi:MAG: hypothetical protein JXD23_15670 [Spirochaetales bacterium]|nr:hypothetical protein [Spirochaetales bacterium]